MYRLKSLRSRIGLNEQSFFGTWKYREYTPRSCYGRGTRFYSFFEKKGLYFFFSKSEMVAQKFVSAWVMEMAFIAGLSPNILHSSSYFV
ncbi:hypothetical protein NDU88_000982, partial [Pleurodeles waltl]